MTTAERHARDFPNTIPGQLEPNPRLDQLRETEPVSRVRPPFGDDAWLVTRYADVRTVLSDPRFSRAAAISETAARATPVVPPPNSIISMDPPDHTRLRRLVGKAFTAATVEQLRPSTEEIADGLLDKLSAGPEPADLVEHLCLPLPIAVMCELLGVRPEDQSRFREWSAAFLSTTSLGVEDMVAAQMKMYAYLVELVNERRANPVDDLLGALVTARDGDARLTEEELVMLGLTILLAGYETTASQLGNFLQLLLTRQDIRDRLAVEPELLPTAIEEMLRHVPVMSGFGFARVATVDVEIGGVLIRAGESVVTSESAANRDPEVFGAIDELDIERHPNPHVSFGHGVHYCLGAQLARMELQVAIGKVLQRLPKLRPAGEPRWKENLMTHGVSALPVAWS